MGVSQADAKSMLQDLSAAEDPEHIATLKIERNEIVAGIKAAQDVERASRLAMQIPSFSKLLKGKKSNQSKKGNKKAKEASRAAKRKLHAPLLSEIQAPIQADSELESDTKSLQVGDQGQWFRLR
jgi:hypothetical protein